MSKQEPTSALTEMIQELEEELEWRRANDYRTDETEDRMKRLAEIREDVDAYEAMLWNEMNCEKGRAEAERERFRKLCTLADPIFDPMIVDQLPKSRTILEGVGGRMRKALFKRSGRVSFIPRIHGTPQLIQEGPVSENVPFVVLRIQHTG